MGITDVDVTPVSCPFEGSLGGNSYEKGRGDTVVVTVRTDGGVTGRTYSGDFGDVGVRGRTKVSEFIRDALSSIAEGTEILATERQWEDMFARTKRFPAWQSEDQWFYITAIGAVDTAIWDAIGKALDTPLYRLLGEYRDSVPIIAIGGYYEEGKGLSELVTEVEEYVEMRMAGMKLKVGKGPVEEGIERLRSVRSAVGDEFVIACDALNGVVFETADSVGDKPGPDATCP